MDSQETCVPLSSCCVRMLSGRPELNLSIAPSLVLESAPGSDLSLVGGWRPSDHLSDAGSEAGGSRGFLLSSPEYPPGPHSLHTCLWKCTAHCRAPGEHQKHWPLAWALGRGACWPGPGKRPHRLPLCDKHLPDHDGTAPSPKWRCSHYCLETQ